MDKESKEQQILKLKKRIEAKESVLECRYISKEQALDTGINVTGNADQINVEIHIMVTYGMNITAIAASITEKVKYIVKEATNIDVDKVVVKIDGIVE